MFTISDVRRRERQLPGWEGLAKAAANLALMESSGQFDDADASRRTQLANERTFLAWWRSGLTALGVSLAVGRVVPELSNQTAWPYAVLGAMYAVFGLAMMIYGTLRQREVDEGIEQGHYVAVERRLLGAFTVLGVAIGLGTVALVVVNA